MMNTGNSPQAGQRFRHCHRCGFMRHSTIGACSNCGFLPPHNGHTANEPDLEASVIPDAPAVVPAPDSGSPGDPERPNAAGSGFFSTMKELASMTLINLEKGVRDGDTPGVRTKIPVTAPVGAGRCPECGSQQPPGHIYCDMCGNRLTRVCRECETVNRPEAHYCHACGNCLRSLA